MNETEPESQSEPFMVVGNRGGRPRAKEPGSTVCVWLPASAHDRLVKLANEQEKSISACVRHLLSVRIDRTLR